MSARGPLRLLREAGTGAETGCGFPRRPNADVVSDTIPLFYVGRNKHGLWVARKAEDGSGGLFLFKQSALRFADESSQPGGCATMFIEEPFELDGESQGSLFVAALDVAIDNVGRFLASVGPTAGQWLHRRSGRRRSEPRV